MSPTFEHTHIFPKDIASSSEIGVPSVIEGRRKISNLFIIFNISICFYNQEILFYFLIYYLLNNFLDNYIN